MVIYNLADTFFVGILNDPIQNAAVTLAFAQCVTEVVLAAAALVMLLRIFRRKN